MTNWQRVAERFRLSRDKAMVKCPCHDDSTASLSVKRDGDDVLTYCFGGCAVGDVRAALGLTFSPRAPNAPQKREVAAPKLEAVHKYTNLAGDVIAEKRRIRYPDGKKETPWSSLDDNGLMRPGLGGMGLDQLNLYNIVAAHYAVSAHGATLFVPEGEGCVDRMTELGLIAVTVPEGASGARTAYEATWRWDAFPRGANVVILPDNDPAGERHARRLGDVLAERFTVSILRLPGLAVKDDVADWVKARRAEDWSTAQIADELCRLAAHACPHPPAPSGPPADVEALEERAAILEHDAGFARADAERAAHAQVHASAERARHALAPAERLMLASTDAKMREIFASLV